MLTGARQGNPLLRQRHCFLLGVALVQVRLHLFIVDALLLLPGAEAGDHDGAELRLGGGIQHFHERLIDPCVHLLPAGHLHQVDGEVLRQGIPLVHQSEVPGVFGIRLRRVRRLLLCGYLLRGHFFLLRRFRVLSLLRLRRRGGLLRLLCVGSVHGGLGRVGLRWPEHIAKAPENAGHGDGQQQQHQKYRRQDWAMAASGFLFQGFVSFPKRQCLQGFLHSTTELHCREGQFLKIF